MIIRQKTGNGYPRSKSRSDPNVVVSLHTDDSYNAANVLTSSVSAGSVITRQHSESIVYTGGVPGHTRQGANFCVHKKYTRQYTGNTSAPAQINTLPPGGNARTEYYSSHRTFAESDHNTAEAEFIAALNLSSIGSGVALCNNNGQGWINQACIDLAPDLKKFSLPNDIIDWKQLGSLVGSWNRTSSLVTNLAGSHLNYKFGIRPTGQDMLALLDGVLGLSDEIKRFQQKIGKIISARKTVLSDSTVKLGTTNFLPYAKRTWRGQIDRKVHAYMVYQPLPILALGNIDRTLRALLTVAGVELNPTIVWDAIPLSFVVDWFLNVGSFLEQYRHKSLELPIQILVTYLQYKERIQVNSGRYFFSDAGQSVKPNVTAETWSTSYLFHRRPVLPDYATFASLQAKFPSANQAILGVSLGAVLGGHSINRFFRSADSATNKLLRYYDYTPQRDNFQDISAFL